MQCSDACAQWKTCPFAGKDVMRLHPKQRPICAFEQEEFDLLQEMDAGTEATPKKLDYHDSREPDPHPMLAQIAGLKENLNLLQVMITRASAALHVLGHTQHVSVTSPNYSMTTSKPSGTMQVLQILNREYRQTVNALIGLYKDFDRPRKWTRPKEKSREEREAEHNAKVEELRKRLHEIREEKKKHQ